MTPEEIAAAAAAKVKADADAAATAAAEAAAKVAKDKADADAAAAAKVAKDKAEADAAEAAAKAAGMNAESAKLLKEVMEKKAALKETQEKLKAFEGIDPAEYKKLKAAADAAEVAAAEAKGDFERVKTLMGAEHVKVVKAKDEALGLKDADIAKMRAQIDELTIGASFNSSEFVKEEIILTPTLARTAYGDYFEVVDGQIVAYDKKKGASERTKMVDATGSLLSFEASMKKLIEADPDRDRILKSKLKVGPSSKTTDGTVKTIDSGEGGRHRITAALNAAAKAK